MKWYYFGIFLNSLRHYLSAESKGLEKGKQVDGVPLGRGHLWKVHEEIVIIRRKCPSKTVRLELALSCLELVETVAAALGGEGGGRAREEVGREELAAHGLREPARVQDDQVAQLPLQVNDLKVEKKT